MKTSGIRSAFTLLLLAVLTVGAVAIQAQQQSVQEQVQAFIEGLPTEEQARATARFDAMASALGRLNKFYPDWASELSSVVLTIQAGREDRWIHEEFKAVSDGALIAAWPLLESVASQGKEEPDRRVSLLLLCWQYRSRQIADPEGPNAARLLSIAYYLMSLDAQRGYCDSAAQALVYAGELARHKPSEMKVVPSQEGLQFLQARVEDCESSEDSAP